MNHIFAAFGQIIALLSILGLGGMLRIGMLLGRRLNRGKPYASLIGIAPQSTNWQCEVVVANTGGRIVLLSPYAILAIHAGGAIPGLPITAVSTTSLEQIPQTVDEGNAETREQGVLPGQYLFFKPQSAYKIKFLSDDAVCTDSNLYQTYETGGLHCSVVLMREDTRGWKGKPVSVCSPWALFGSNIATTLREEVKTLAHKQHTER
jgi:hypothetical protein